MPHFVIATAGHVDHGKSALVKALTGTDPDRLPEEKARGITIQLGFAHLTLPASDGRPEFHLGIVDVPGHEDFVKNMVAGVGSIDLALLVVAADDGWMPQTEEHLQILTYLGVTQAVVVLTKIDLAAAAEEAVTQTVQEKLRDTPFASAPIIPASIVTGEGLEKLREKLSTILAKLSPQADTGKPRLPIDRVFTLRGIGVVVTGTLTGGTFRRGQRVTIQPAGLSARVRSVQNHNEEIELAAPGMRTALSLPDVSAHTEAGGQGSGVQRGDVVTLAELGNANDTADVVIERLPRLIDTRSGVAPPLKDGKRVRVHHGSGNFPARLIMKIAELRPGERTLAQLQFESPVFAFAGDRFILRDWSEQRTLAGGMILDPDASRRRFRSSAQQEFLARRASSDEASAFICAQLARDGAVPRSSLLVKSHFSAAEITKSITSLELEKVAVVADGIIADAVWWQALERIAADAIAAWHRAQPEESGIPLNELRALVERDPRAAGVFDALVVRLCRGGFERAGVAIRHASHRPALPPHLRVVGERVRAALAGKPLEPPPRKELLGDAAAQQALRFLIQSGEAVEVSPEIVFSAQGLFQARELVQAFLRAHRAGTVSELRQALGTSRRVIVPLLEYLDRAGVTRRDGDKRSLRAPAVTHP